MIDAIFQETVRRLRDQGFQPPPGLRKQVVTRVFRELMDRRAFWVGPPAPIPTDIEDRNDRRRTEEAAEEAEAIRKGKEPPPKTKEDTTVFLPLREYDAIIVGFSGGKDSLACLLHLLDLTRDDPGTRSKIELWHHAVDGRPGSTPVFDWACTEAYCRAVAHALGVPLRFSWREGGILREMQRDQEWTQGVGFEDIDDDGQEVERFVPTRSGNPVTRRLLDAEGKPTGSPAWPQQSGDLNVRWCSAYAKIMVAGTAINNSPRLKRGKILLVTGERREESAGRSRYPFAVQHRSTTKERRVDQVRLVLDWNVGEVWGILQRWGIVPHPCYWLGFGRASCETCIFLGRDEWATLAEVDPDRVAFFADLEAWAKTTIERGRSILERIRGGYVELRGRGKARQEVIVPPAVSLLPPRAEGLFWKELATSHEVLWPVRVDPERWSLPPGAFRTGAGPT